MIPELGHAALIVALQLALLQGVLGLAGAARGHAGWMAMARGAVAGQLLFVVLGFGALIWSFLVNDFSVMNVADHSSRHLPVQYRLTAAWGSHEGSFLLWTTLMAGWTLAVVFFSRDLPVELVARVIGVMGLLSSCFLAFILFTSNPFMRLHPPPANGGDLNPLLQDPGMIIHPPLLYMGYVGFSVAFAFAVAALMSGKLDATWARWVRPWTLVAWSFLTLGIMVGSWWAYYELGWGGWWFWDPSENASLMPWLAGTALLHSLVVTDRRGSLRVWTVFLALGAFSLSLLGTFLVRSGVLSSVHAFAQDPLRGLFILIFLGIVIGGSLLLFARQAGALKTTGDFRPVSRETAILTGNVLLLAALGTVLLGTLYPLLLDAFDLGKISVGPPYFNTVFVPMMAPVLLLLGIAPHLRWREARLADGARRLRWPALTALIVAGTVPLGFGEWRWQAALGLGLATWMILATVGGLLARRRAAGSLPPGAFGMGSAHCGLALGIIGMGLVSAYQSEKTVAMSNGDGATLGGYEFVFRGVAEIPGPNYAAMRGTLELSRDGKPVAVLLPEKRIYAASRMAMTEAAIRYGVFGDVYAALGEPLPGGAWSVQLYFKPFVGWLWAGAGLMALGGLLAALGARREKSALAGRHEPEPPRAWTHFHAAWPLASGLVVLVITGTAGLYLYLGAPAILQEQALTRAQAAYDTDAMLQALEDKLKAQPGDAEGWYALGRAYIALQRLDDAEQALAKAVQLMPTDAKMLAQYAEAIAVRTGSLQGRPLELVMQALDIDYEEEKALELAGLAAFQQERWAESLHFWRRLLKRLPKDSEFHDAISEAVRIAEGKLAAR